MMMKQHLNLVKFFVLVGVLYLSCMLTVEVMHFTIPFIWSVAAAIVIFKKEKEFANTIKELMQKIWNKYSYKSLIFIVPIMFFLREESEIVKAWCFYVLGGAVGGLVIRGVNNWFKAQAAKEIVIEGASTEQKEAKKANSYVERLHSITNYIKQVAPAQLKKKKKENK